MFPSKRVSYHGQPLGLIVGITEKTAQNAAKLVKVTYSDEKPPTLTVEQALKNPLPPGQPDPVIIGDVEGIYQKIKIFLWKFTYFRVQ